MNTARSAAEPFSYEEFLESKDSVKAALSEHAPFVIVNISTLGGNRRSAMLIAFSMSSKEEWPNGIFENSRYGHISINADGTVTNFSGSRPFMRKFHAKNLDDAVRKICLYIDQRKALTAAVSKEGIMNRQAIALELLKVSKSLLAENTPKFGIAFEEFFDFCSSKSTDIDATTAGKYTMISRQKAEEGKKPFVLVDEETGDVFMAMGKKTPQGKAVANVFKKSTWKNVGA